MSNVICIGSAAKDIFFPTSEGEFLDTPEDIMAQRKVAFEVGAKYQIEDRYEAIGGVAANTSVGLARLGITASCYGGIGDDDIGAWIRREFGREGVDMRLLEEYENVKSDLSAILVFTKDGERTIFYNRDSAERFRADAEKFSGASWVMMSALNGVWEENMRQTIAGAKAVGAKLAVNPGQKNMKENSACVLEAVEQADILFLNKDEAIELVSHLSHDTASLNNERFLLRSLFRHGVKKIAMTDGVRGAWGYDGRTFFRAVSRKPEHGVDTTGAGDAFGSAFLAAEIFERPLAEALQWGMANGASVVMRYGAIDGLLSREKIEEYKGNIVVEPVKW